MYAGECESDVGLAISNAGGRQLFNSSVAPLERLRLSLFWNNYIESLSSFCVLQILCRSDSIG